MIRTEERRLAKKHFTLLYKVKEQVLPEKRETLHCTSETSYFTAFVTQKSICMDHR